VDRPSNILTSDLYNTESLVRFRSSSKEEGSRTLGDDDIGLEVIPVGDSVGDGELPALGIGDAVSRELLLAHVSPGAAVVVLRVDDCASLVAGQVGDDVAPPLVVVDPDRDDEVLAGVGDEADGAGGAAATHGEGALFVGMGPGSTVGVVPNGLFDDVEIGVAVGLIDTEGDIVAHSKRR